MWATDCGSLPGFRLIARRESSRMRRHDGARTGGPVPPVTPPHTQSGAYEYLSGPGGAPAASGAPAPHVPGTAGRPGEPPRQDGARPSRGRTIAIGAAIAIAAASASGGAVYLLSSRDAPAGGSNPAVSAPPEAGTGDETEGRPEHQAGSGDEQDAAGGEEPAGGGDAPGDAEPVGGGTGGAGGASGGGSGGSGGSGGGKATGSDGSP